MSEQSLEKSRLKFNLLIGGSVIVLSFFYGLSAGLHKKLGQANASAFNGVPFSVENFNDREVSERLSLVDGIHLMPIGNDITLNGKAADMVTFVSRVPVQKLVNAQVLRWQQRGFLAFGSTSPVRGVALAVNQARGERYTFTAWSVPPSLRARLGGTFSVQGIVAGLSADVGAGDPEGLVPGVPLMPGGHAGAVISSKDNGGASYTSAYTNPGSLAANVSFYEVTLSNNGWRASDSGALFAQAGDRKFLSFARGNEEVTLLFSPVEDATEEKTAVTVILAPVMALQ